VRKKLQANVKRVIKSAHPSLPEKAEISIDEADDLYREIRIGNRLTTESGTVVRLKEAAQMDVQIEADRSATAGKT
jgi:hypothetical protein